MAQAISQHKRMAMGDKVTGMKKGGFIVAEKKRSYNKGGSAKCPKCGAMAHGGKC